MSRTPIPPHLLHRPEEVERDAERFDHLCRLAEEVAFPIVQKALIRETTNTGAEVLTEEAKHTLEAFAEDAAFFENFDEKELLKELQISLSEALPPPDEKECREHARDLSQVLMGTWLESLRSAESEGKIVILSNYLIPPTLSQGMFHTKRSWDLTVILPGYLIDAIAPFAVDEEDVLSIMLTLRVKLFPEECLVDLPFDLALIGAPERPVLVTSRTLYERLGERIRHLDKREAPKRPAVERLDRNYGTVNGQPVEARFKTDPARRAVEVLSKPLPAGQYWYLEKAASPSSDADATEVRRALSVP